MFQPGANLYTQGFGSRPEGVEVPHLETRDPSPTDIMYPVGKSWLNTISQEQFILYRFQVTNSITEAVWGTPVGSTGAVVTLSDTGSTKVFPDSDGNIQLQGVSHQISTQSNPGAHDIQIGLPTSLNIPGSLSANGGPIGLAVTGSSPVTIGNTVGSGLGQQLVVNCSTVCSQGLSVQNGFQSQSSLPTPVSSTFIDSPICLFTSLTLAGQATYNATGGEGVLQCTTSGGAITVNLSSNSFSGAFFVIYDFSGNAATNNITINAPAGMHFFVSGSAPSTSYTINTNYGNLFAIFDQSTLNIIVLNH